MRNSTSWLTLPFRAAWRSRCARSWRWPRLIAAGGLLALLAAPPSAGAQAGRCAEPRGADGPVRLLIVTGGHSYEPSEFFATFAAMPEVHYQHYYLWDGQPLSVPEGGLGQYDVVLFYDLQQGEITPEWRSLLDRGRGFVFLHHALGSFRRSPEYKAIVGGHANFRGDSVPGVPNTTYHFNVRQRFTITDPAHPVTCGIGDFEMLDEAYDNMGIDPRAHILMTSDYPKISPAAAWTWSYQRKRVIYLQPGHGNLGLPPDHGPSSYQSEPFKRLLRRAILWAAGRL
jgi:hypothetical protein